MKRKSALYLMAGLASSGGLAACADSTTAPTLVATTTTTNAATTSNPVSASPANPTTVAGTTASTATASPTAQPAATTALNTSPALPTTAGVTPTAAATPTTVVPATTATTLPSTATVAPSVAPSPTATPAFTPTDGATLKTVSPANSGYYFNFVADGRLVFYAKADNRVGSWAATIGNPAWQFLASGFGNFTPDLALAALSDKAAGTTVITQLDGSKTLANLQNWGSATIFSPADAQDKRQIAYLLRAAQQDGPEEPQHFDLWVANTDSTQARSVWTGLEAANLAWFPGGRKLLWTGRDAANQKFGLWALEIAQTAQSANPAAYIIIASKGISVASLSPDGQWVAYWVTLQGDKFSGVWLARADGSQAQKLDWQGGFRWADTGELFYIPARKGSETDSTLWSLDPATGKSTRLTDPAQVPLKMALDQWQVAPGAKSIVFRNAADNALWQCVFRP